MSDFNSRGKEVADRVLIELEIEKKRHSDRIKQIGRRHNLITWGIYAYIILVSVGVMTAVTLQQ